MDISSVARAPSSHRPRGSAPTYTWEWLAPCPRAIAAMLLLLPGCRPQHAVTPDREVTAARASAEPLLQVTDGLGRKFTLSRIPQRIVSLAPKNTEMLFALGAGDRVVGVTNYCNYPEAATRVAKVGGFSTKSLSFERIVALEPDLVLAAGELHAPVIEELDRLGIATLALSADSFAGMCDELQLLGRITGHEAEAEQVVESLQDRISRIRQTASEISQEDRVSVCYLVADEPLTAAGRSTYLGEMIELSGAVNAIRDPAAKFPKISDEAILTRDPQVIMAPSHHAAFLTEESLNSRPGWSRLQAVRSRRTYVLDGNLASRCGPRLVDALEQMAHTLYPSRFAAPPIKPLGELEDREEGPQGAPP